MSWYMNSNYVVNFTELVYYQKWTWEKNPKITSQKFVMEKPSFGHIMAFTVVFNILEPH